MKLDRLLLLPLAVLPLAALACGPATAENTWSDSILLTTGPAGSYALFGQCLPHTPAFDADHVPACVVIEARHTGGACACDAAARQPVSAAHAGVVNALMRDPGAAEVAPDCFCEVSLLTGAQADACAAGATQVDGQSVDGVCYIDATVSPAIGNVEIAAQCPAAEERLLRFVGAGVPAPTSRPETVMLFTSCENG